MVPIQASFRIHPNAVYQLGENLITDEVQALLELIKNSYDANAKKVIVRIQTKGDTFLSIADDGDGMTVDDIQRGWLTIAFSQKYVLKNSTQASSLVRIPLGDKGLGRLGAQRIARGIEVVTKPKSEDREYSFSFRWDAFSKVERVEDVSVSIASRDIQATPRTLIVLQDLRDPAYWTGNLLGLQLQLSKLLSPYQDIAKFSLTVEIDGTKLDLLETSAKVLQTAQAVHLLEFDKTHLTFSGKVKLSYIRPKKADELSQWNSLVTSDNGERFLAYLSERSQSKDYCLTRSEEPNWYIEYRNRPDHSKDAELQDANPGAFTARADFFDFSTSTLNEQSIFDKKADYKDFVKGISGIQVYRDGFAVRLDSNWLDLGEQWTSAGSYYSLKPANTIGYISISAKENPLLEEKTDREGFLKSAYYFNFRRLLDDWVQFTEEIQAFIRRGWHDFKAKYAAETAGVADKSPQEVSTFLADQIAETRKWVGPIEVYTHSVQQTVDRAKEVVRVADSSLFGGEPELEEAVKTLEKDAEQAKNALVEIRTFMNTLSEQERLGRVLSEQIGLLQSRLEEVYSLVSLGLTAEALTHQISQVIEDMTLATGQMKKTAQARPQPDSSLFTYLSRIEHSLASLRKQLSHLAPSLKYVRETKERIVLHTFFSDQEEYIHSRQDGKVALRIVVPDSDPLFAVRMNVGKLVQVFDNLFLNSEFWLLDSRTAEPTVFVELDSPIVRVWDNGPGVDVSVENSLFEAFVTRKPRFKGRGLGLFIVRQLLDGDDVTINLSEKRNEQGRRYQFEIDFSSVLDGEN